MLLESHLASIFSHLMESLIADSPTTSPFYEIVRAFDLCVPFQNRQSNSDSYPRTADEEVKSKNVWLKGHTGKPWRFQYLMLLSDTSSSLDIGGVTILWSQPIAALQILSSEGKWQWVRHIDNALVSQDVAVARLRI